MPAPLDPEKRAAIEQDVRDGALSRNAIARKHDVSGATVSKIGKKLEAEGVAPLCDRSQTKDATRARAVDTEARRTELAALLLEDAFQLRDRMWSKQKALVLANVKGGGQRVEIVERDTEAGEFRNYMTAIAIGIDKQRVLTEKETGAAEAASLISSLVGDIRARRGGPVADAAQ